MIQDINQWRSDLNNKVHFDNDKVLLNEAIDCYHSKSYRAGYIVAWLTIVESLRLKIKELSNTGNKQAEISLGNIIKEEDALKSNDMKIIEEALICGFVNKTEKDEIMFLWGQRCKFAHPYYMAPTAMELAHIIEKSISLALCKQILFKKEYIDDLVNDICNTHHFIKDDFTYVVDHAKQKIARIDSILHPYFFKTLFFKYSESIDKEVSKIFIRRINFYIAEILFQNKENIDKPEWRLEEQATKFVEKFALLIDNRTWPLLNRRLKDLVMEYIKSESISQLKREARLRIKHLIRKGILEEPYLSDFYSFLDQSFFRVTSEFYQSTDAQLLNRALALIETNDYYDNGYFIDFMYSEEGVNFVAALSKTDLDRIAHAIDNSAWNNCFASKNFIRSRGASEIRLFCALVKGCFNYDEEMIYINRQVLDILSHTINKTDHPLLSEAFTEIDNLTSNFNFGENSYNSWFKDLNEGLESILKTEFGNPIFRNTLVNIFDKVMEYSIAVKEKFKESPKI